jgi:radical SAM superfamily enzyme YgiQ (UPF0313 family)
MIDAADERGIMVGGFFMLGFPTETEAEIQATIEFALRSRLTMAYFFQVVPQPETPLWNLALQESSEAALAEYTAEDEHGATYRDGISWYEVAYGRSVDDIVRNAYARFYLRPSQVFRVLRRAPWRYLPRGLVHLIMAVLGL